MAHDFLRNCPSSECVVQTQGISTRGGAEVEPQEASVHFWRFFPGHNTLIFSLMCLLARGFSGKEGHCDPQHPEHHKTGKVSPKDNASICEEAGGRRRKDEKMTPGNMCILLRPAWPRQSEYLSWSYVSGEYVMARKGVRTYANLRLWSGDPLKSRNVRSGLGIQDSLLGQGMWWNIPALTGWMALLIVLGGWGFVLCEITLVTCPE